MREVENQRSMDVEERRHARHSGCASTGTAVQPEWRWQPLKRAGRQGSHYQSSGWNKSALGASVSRLPVPTRNEFREAAVRSCGPGCNYRISVDHRSVKCIDIGPLTRCTTEDFIHE